MVKFKEGQELEVRFGNSRYKKFKVAEDFYSDDKKMKLYDTGLRQEFQPLRSKCKIRNKELEMENNWKDIKEKIKHSSISRFPWGAVLGQTLTNVIQTYNLNGFDSEETYYKIIEGIKFKEMIKELPIKEQDKLKDKIKISVAARFGEKNSSDKLKDTIKPKHL